MSNTLHLFFSFLTVPSSSKGKITEDNRALRNTGLLYISFLDLYMEEIIVWKMSIVFVSNDSLHQPSALLSGN